MSKSKFIREVLNPDHIDTAIILEGYSVRKESVCGSGHI